MKFLLRSIYFVGYKLAKCYWFLCRPKALGTKCVVRCGDELLLIRNSYGPRGWTFPGGGVKKTEDFKTAAARELAEEVGVSGVQLVYCGTFLLTEEYKRDTVHVFCGALVDKPSVVVDNTEVVEARWFSPSSLPKLTPSGIESLRVYAGKS